MTEYAAARASSVGSTRMLRYRSRPVPAGISFPMITFSFRPRSESELTVDRRVGEDAGGLLEGGRREPRLGRQRRLGDAHEHRTTGGGLAALGDHAAVLLLEATRSTRSDGSRLVSPDSMHRDPAQHLPHDDLDVLVVDGHALAAVHRLDLVHQVLLRLADTQDAQDLLRVGRARVSCWPTSTWSPSATSRRDRLQTGYSWTSEPSSGVTRILLGLVGLLDRRRGRRPR